MQQEHFFSVEEWHEIINNQDAEGIVFSSSGSADIEKSLVYTENTLIAAVRRTQEFFRAIFDDFGKKVVITWGYGLFPPALFYTLALANLGMTVYPFGSGRNYRIEDLTKQITEINPEVIVGMPSYLSLLYKEIENSGLDECLSQIQYIITGGEVLDKQQRYELESNYGAKVYDHYGMLQFPMIAGECKCGKLHISKEITAQVMMDNGIISDVGKGELILSSNIMWDSMKDKKLKTGDNVILNEYTCSCGIKTKTIEIVGRKDRRIKVRGQVINFQDIISKLNLLGYKGYYYFEISNRQTDELLIYLDNNVDSKKILAVTEENVPIKYKIISKKNFVMPRSNSGKIKYIVRRGVV